MHDEKIRKLHYWLSWSGMLLMVLFFFAMIVLGHNYPPPDPRFTAQELVTNHYLKYRSDIMLGMSLCACFGGLYLIFTCMLAAKMREKEKVPVLSYIQLSGGILTTWILVMMPSIWVYCAESAGQIDPEIIKTLHFVSWYIFNMTYIVTTFQCWAIGIFTLIYTEKPVLFPKWAGWAAIVVGASWFPLSVLPYHKTGPFAINGWWAWHLIVAGFGLFTISYSYYMIVDAKRIRISPAMGMGQAVRN